MKRAQHRSLDRRYRVARELAKWREDLIQDLGGDVSTQQSAVVDLAVKTKLLLDSVDVWLFTQKLLVNTKKRALLPAVVQRQVLADGLARYLAQLGLERKAKTKTLEEILNEGESEEENKP